MENAKVDKQRSNRSEAGTTLVELMIAMVISSIVVFFLFTIQGKMSAAYRGQGTISEVVQNLQAARQMLVLDIRMAGFGLAPSTGAIGVASTVDPTESLIGFSVTNDAYGDGNDTFRVLSGDTIDNIRVDTSLPGTNFGNTFIDYAPASAALALAIGQTIVVSGPNFSCLLAITGFTGTDKFHFNDTGVGAPYNSAGNGHCDDVKAEAAANSVVTIQRLVSRSYRIDPVRTAAGYLQMSPSGETVPNDWIDLGVGFTNLQIATRYFETGDLVDSDGDGDHERDWYSSDNQAIPDPTGVRPVNAVLIQTSIALEGRGVFGNLSSIPTIATTAFTDLSNVDHNPIGDWGQACAGAPQDPCGIHLAVTPDAARPARYEGEHIYRYVKATVDLRNIGVGQ